MSGYFSQLIRQAGVKITGAAPFPESLTGPAPGAHDLVIEESAFTPSTGFMTQPNVQPDFPTDSAPIESEQYARTDKPFATQSEVESGEPPNARAPRESWIAVAAPSEIIEGTVVSSFAATPAASPLPASNSARSQNRVIQEVMDWIAEPLPVPARVPNDPAKSVLPPVRVVAAAVPEQRALDDDHRLVPNSVPASALSFYQTVEHARPAASPPSKSGDEAWSVHIDAIHLEIEAPKDKPSPRLVAPQPVSSSSSLRPRGSRLRRYYLRNC